MDVVDVLKEVRAETASTHWCKGHYETMIEWFGSPEDFLARMPRRWQKRTGLDGVEAIYKVQHCLVGMVNVAIGIRVARASTDSIRLIEDGDKRDLWVETINRLGRTIFGEEWDSSRRDAPNMIPVGNIENWNDLNETSKEDILEVLDRAIAKG